MENCIIDDPKTISFREIMYPLIPAEEPIPAITLSRVLSPKVIHLTSAKDVNENTKVIHAAAAIDGASNGAHKYLNLPILFEPAGSNRICSSSLGSRVEITGSQNLITSAILNQAWAIINVRNHVESSTRMFRPALPTICKKPIAATIEGITNGIVRMAFVSD